MLNKTNLCYNIFHLEQPTLNSEVRNKIKESTSSIISQIATLNETKSIQIYNEFDLSDFLINNEKFLIDPAGHSYEVPGYILDEQERARWDEENVMLKGWKYGEIGVWASNYLALKSFIDSNFEYAIYFEDDFEIKEGFIELLQNCFSDLPEDWDVLYPYSHKREEYWYETMKDIVNIEKKYICKTWHELSQACYLINKKGAKKILDYIENYGISKPIDVAFLRKPNNIITYGSKPVENPPYEIKNFPSTFQYGQTKNLTDVLKKIERISKMFINNKVNSLDEVVLKSKLGQKIDKSDLFGIIDLSKPEDNSPFYSFSYRSSEDGYIYIDYTFNTHTAKRLKKIPGYDQQIEYRLNNKLFRSQHFKQLDESRINILYAGCSYTYGDGLPEELIWSGMLTSKLKDFYKNKNIEAFNVASSGIAIDGIISNVYKFIHLYGKPNYLFMLLPDLGRKTYFVKKQKKYLPVHLAVDVFNVTDETAKHVKTFTTEDSMFYNFSLIHQLEIFCKMADIKLVWSFWAHEDKNEYATQSFDNIFYEKLDKDGQIFKSKNPLGKNGHLQPCKYENKNNLPFWLMAQDNVHPGTSYHEMKSDEFFNEVIARYENN